MVGLTLAMRFVLNHGRSNSGNAVCSDHGRSNSGNAVCSDHGRSNSGNAFCSEPW